MYELEIRIWLKAACSAIAGCASSVEKRTDEFNAAIKDLGDMVDEDDIIKDDCGYAAKYADGILKEFQEKFKGCY